MKSIFNTMKSSLVLEMKFYAPGSFNEHTQSLFLCAFPSLCYLLLSTQVVFVIFMNSWKYNTDLKFQLTRHTQETEFLNGAQFCPCSRFNCHTLNFNIISHRFKWYESWIVFNFLPSQWFMTLRQKGGDKFHISTNYNTKT